MASSRGVTRIFGSGRPSALVKVDLVRPSSRARSFIMRTNEASFPAMPSASAMQPSLADWMITPFRRSSTFTRLCSAAYMVEPRRHRPAFAPGVLADDEGIGELDVAEFKLLEHHIDGHELGKARRRNQRVGALLEQHASRFRPRSEWHAGRRSAAAPHRWACPARPEGPPGPASSGKIAACRTPDAAIRRADGPGRSKMPGGLLAARLASAPA